MGERSEEGLREGHQEYGQYIPCCQPLAAGAEETLFPQAQFIEQPRKHRYFINC